MSNNNTVADNRKEITTAGGLQSTTAQLAKAFAVISLALVAILHFLKPEQDPSWHMLSEYAIGEFGWVMQLSFYSWAFSSIALAIAIRSHLKSKGGKTGVALLFVVGLAIITAGIFVIDSPSTPKDQLTMHGNLHGLASMIGVPGFPIAAVLISRSLARRFPAGETRKLIMGMAHFTWISLVLMIVAVILVFTVYEGKFGPGAMIGWANRIYNIACCCWLITIARIISNKSLLN